MYQGPPYDEEDQNYEVYGSAEEEDQDELSNSVQVEIGYYKTSYIWVETHMFRGKRSFAKSQVSNKYLIRHMLGRWIYVVQEDNKI